MKFVKQVNRKVCQERVIWTSNRDTNMSIKFTKQHKERNADSLEPLAKQRIHLIEFAMRDKSLAIADTIPTAADADICCRFCRWELWQLL